MESNINCSLLNKAHLYARWATSKEKVKKFDEAWAFHEKAIEFLKKSVEVTSFKRSRESILLQIEFHKAQEQVIEIRKLQKVVEEKLKVEEDKFKKMEKENIKNSNNHNTTLQLAIYRNIDAADSLITTLAEQSNGLLRGTQIPEQNHAIVKHPKGDDTVIEELKTLNNQLRGFITQLLNDLEEKEQEVTTLKERIKYLESKESQQNNDEVVGEGNLIDFNSMSSSGESIGTIP